MNPNINRVTYILFAVFWLFCFVFCPDTEAQVVGLIFEMQAYSTIKVSGSREDILIENGRREADCIRKKLIPFIDCEKPLNWIEVTASENIQLGVKLIPRNPCNSPQAAYLNTGNFNPSQALPLNDRGNVFVMNRDGRLIRDIAEYRRSLNIWLIVPPDEIEQIIIEYH